MDCAFKLEINSEWFKHEFADSYTLKYNHPFNEPVISIGNIGDVRFRLQDLDYDRRSPDIRNPLKNYKGQYEKELQEWVQEQNASNPEKILEVYMDPNLNWTSEKFDFMLVQYKFDKNRNRKIETIHLMDLFRGPYNNVATPVCILLSQPKTIEFLENKLFRKTAHGLELKEKYKIDSMIRSRKLYPIPITELMVRMVERSYCFNRSLPISGSSPGSIYQIPCKYGSLCVDSQTPISTRMKNWISTGIMEREIDIYTRGPSWYCTLTKILKENGQYPRTARIHDGDGKWRTVIVD